MVVLVNYSLWSGFSGSLRTFGAEFCIGFCLQNWAMSQQLKMTGPGQNVKKTIPFAEICAVFLMIYGQFGAFFASFLPYFCPIWHVYLLPISQGFFANGATVVGKRHEAALAQAHKIGA